MMHHSSTSPPTSPCPSTPKKPDGCQDVDLSTTLFPCDGFMLEVDAVLL